MSEKITCECGSTIQKRNFNKHIQTNKHLKGAGLFDIIKSGVKSVKGMFTKRESFNNVSTRTLKEYGNMPIIRMQIARQPVVKALDSVINIISLGTWGSLKKKYGFDELMHLGLIVTVQQPNGSPINIMIEKVDAVTISTKISMDKAQYLEVPMKGQSLTINEMVDKAIAKVGNKTFFDYSGLGVGNQPPNNCQYFILYLLQNSNLLDQKSKDFLFQDVEKLAQQMPEYAKKIMNTVTDLGQLGNKWLGKGLHLHAVHVNKRVPLEQAKVYANDIIQNKKKRHYRETAKLHKFRNLPRGEFIAGSLKKEKIDKNISVYLGIKKGGEGVQGAGLWDDLVNTAVSKVKDYVIPKTKHEVYKSSSLVPDTKILYQMAEASYNKDPVNIAPYKRILKTPYLTAYRDGKTLILAVRGTDVKDSKDLVADVSIALGALRNSPRFKSDVEEIKKLKKIPELSHLYWIGTGHSLGSALIDEFLKLGFISEAVTFNGAVSQEFYNVNNKNRRIYMSNDPLYLIMGRNTKYHEVRENPNVHINKAHNLSNFVGGRY
jgi:hypothetical protein